MKMSERSDGPIQKVSSQVHRCGFLPATDEFGANLLSGDCSTPRWALRRTGQWGAAVGCCVQRAPWLPLLQGVSIGKGWGLIEISYLHLSTVYWQFVSIGNLSHCPSHSTPDIMEALRINRPKLLRGFVCPNWGGNNMSLQLSSTDVMPLEGRATDPSIKRSHKKNWIWKSYNRNKPPNSQRPFRESTSPQLPSSQCLAKGALWQILGFLGGLVQRSSVGLQPGWGRYLSSTSNLTHGNGVCLRWWDLLLVLLFVSRGCVLFCDWCDCGTCDAVCAILCSVRKATAFNGKALLSWWMITRLLECELQKSLVTSWRILGATSKGDWVQNHPTGSPNDFWVSWQRFGIGWDRVAEKEWPTKLTNRRV